MAVCEITRIDDTARTPVGGCVHYGIPSSKLSQTGCLLCEVVALDHADAASQRRAHCGPRSVSMALCKITGIGATARTPVGGCVHRGVPSSKLSQTGCLSCEVFALDHTDAASQRRSQCGPSSVPMAVCEITEIDATARTPVGRCVRGAFRHRRRARQAGFVE